MLPIITSANPPPDYLPISLTGNDLIFTWSVPYRRVDIIINELRHTTVGTADRQFSISHNGGTNWYGLTETDEVFSANLIGKLTANIYNTLGSGIKFYSGHVSSGNNSSQLRSIGAQPNSLPSSLNAIRIRGLSGATPTSFNLCEGYLIGYK